MGVKAVNTPVEICGMDVCTGEIVHMDENGCVKFPREYLEEVLENCKILSAQEEKKIKMLQSTGDVDLLAKYMQGVYD